MGVFRMRNLERRSARWLIVLVVLVGFLVSTCGAHAAPTATISAIVLDVNCQTAPNKAWVPAKIGMQLPVGSRVRTGRRSKCEVKFPGGSIARLAPRSELQISSVTGAGNKVKLMSGQVLVNVVKGYGVDIEGAKATVAIQGTWVLFDGEQPTVWKGTATMQTGAGDVPISDQRTAKYGKTSVPLVGTDGKRLGTITADVQGQNLVVTYDVGGGLGLGVVDLYVGVKPPADSTLTSVPHVSKSLGGQSHNQYIVPLSEISAMSTDTIYMAAHASLKNPGGGSAGDAWGKGTLIGSGPGMYFTFNPIITAKSYPFEFPTGSLRPWWGDIKEGVSTQSTPGTGIGGDIKQAELASPLTINGGFFNPGSSGPGGVDVIVRGGQSAALATGGQIPFQLMAAGLASGLSLADGNPISAFGKQFYLPRSQADVFGLLDTDGNSFAGLRARASMIADNVYIEVGDLITTGFKGSIHNELSEGFGVFKTGGNQITIGRQHYLESVANNSTLGTQFPTLTFDGIRMRQEIWNGSLDVIRVDRFEDGLVRPDDSGGWLGRLRFPLGQGQIGATVFNQRKANAGTSLDFTYPVAPGYLDLYGEYGTDPLGQRLQTWGAYFPKFYQENGVDLFVEYAAREGFPSIWSALGYKEMSHGWTGFLGLRKASDEKSLQAAIGFIKRFGTLGD